MPPVRLSCVDWSDNFDSYATGSQLHGQGGWKGWFNDPAAGALASSAQARSAPNSADIVGAIRPGARVQRLHQRPLGLHRLAVRTRPTSPASSYFILLNQYDDAGATNNWSTQVRFDCASEPGYDDDPVTAAGGNVCPW